MNVVSQLCRDVSLPKMVKVKQNFCRDSIKKENVASVVNKELSREQIKREIKPGMRVAITCGSRGIANIAIMIKAMVDFVKECGAVPFVFPAMGSHGGATDAGQRQVLASYGVTEDYLGCPVLSSMQTKQIGETEDGIPVFIDKNAAEADAVLLCNRVKAHTAFQGPYESGLMKMCTIGMGKQHGAEFCHESGFKNMAVNVPKIARVILKNVNVVAGIAVIENAFDQTYKIVGLTNAEIPEKEPELLIEAKKMMGKILFESTDVLVVDRIGKNISGDGMDPNVTGRALTPYVKSGINAQNIAVLDLTEETHGNANGIGLADVTTKRLVNKMDVDISYPNAVTSTELKGVKIPLYVENDKEAVQLAIRACNEIDKKAPRVIRIQDTMNLEYIYISEAMVEEAKRNPNLEIVGEPEEWSFNEQGNLW